MRRTADVWGGTAASETRAALVYALVDSKPASREMKSNQPFLFYPELNGVGRDKLLRYK